MDSEYVKVSLIQGSTHPGQSFFFIFACYQLSAMQLGSLCGLLKPALCASQHQWPYVARQLGVKADLCGGHVV